jgi:excinuclease ABC subunit A
LIARNDTIVLIEHNITLLKQLDYFIEMGPKAGRYGGKITAQGPFESFINDPQSVTAPYLKG